MHEKSGTRSLVGSLVANDSGIPALARCQDSLEELTSVKTTASNPVWMYVCVCTHGVAGADADAAVSLAPDDDDDDDDDND